MSKRLQVIIADGVYPMEHADIEKTKDILQGYTTLSAIDAVHLAIMKRHGIAILY